MSLALVRQRFAQDGGAERFVSRMLEALRRHVSLTLVTRQWERAEGADVVIVNPFYLGRLWRDWSFARAVCRELKTRSFDLVQSHERVSCCDIYRAGDGVHREWLRQLARVRGPFGRLGLALNPYHCYTKWAEKKMFTGPRLKAVICNSRMVKEEIRCHFNVPEERLHVVYSGVDTKVFHPRLKQFRGEIRLRYGIPADAVVFLFVGSGFRRKGVAALLEAMASLPDNACLLVVGRDKKEWQYRRQAHNLGLTNRVVFAGSQADVKPFYGAADALVLPTLYDPFPNVTLEAMACGLPIVTTRKCGAAELIEEGRDGFVCAPDGQALVGPMSALMDVARAGEMGERARRAVEPLSLERMAHELVALYGRLLPHRRA